MLNRACYITTNDDPLNEIMFRKHCGHKLEWDVATGQGHLAQCKLQNRRSSSPNKITACILDYLLCICMQNISDNVSQGY